MENEIGGKVIFSFFKEINFLNSHMARLQLISRETNYLFNQQIERVKMAKNNNYFLGI